MPADSSAPSNTNTNTDTNASASANANADANANASAILRVRIREILDNGGFQYGDAMRLAKEVGVARQLVDILKRQMASADWLLIEHPELEGSNPARVPFSEQEREVFAAALRGPVPKQHGGHRPKNPDPAQEKRDPAIWSVDQAQAWFFRRFGRCPRRHLVKVFAREIGVVLFVKSVKKDRAAMVEKTNEAFQRWLNSPEAKAIRERETKLAATFAALAPKPIRTGARGRPRLPRVITDEQILEIQRINRETIEQLRERQAAQAAAEETPATETPAPAAAPTPAPAVAPTPAAPASKQPAAKKDAAPTAAKKPRVPRS
ncbi:MAG: hypothetical protein LBT53_06720 [Puniceicoccales bacterium]|jgi:hypothetical protein|nr:hypothetical protein [Puniceicoccales bacterium]